MLKQRLITASLLIPLILWMILNFSSLVLASMMGCFVIIAAWEWTGICELSTLVTRIIYVFFVLCSLFIIYKLLKDYTQGTIYLLSIINLWWLGSVYWLWRYQQGFDLIPRSRIIKSLLGLLILLPPWAALVILHQDTHYGGSWVIFLLVLIWTADTGAYFAGRRWGQMKLADKISPGKTWEGVVGGLLSSSAVTLSYALLQAMSLFKIVIFVTLCLLTVIVSIVGDLLESLFKRQVGLKDSSQFLPGHGGVLDRIDSLTAAAPLFVTGLILLGNLS